MAALSASLVKQFANKLNGGAQAVQMPGGPSGQVPVIRVGTVQSNDTTRFVTLVQFVSGTTNVPVVVLDGNYPLVGSMVSVLVFGTSFYLMGEQNVVTPIGGLVGTIVGPSSTTSYSTQTTISSATAFTLYAGQKYRLVLSLNYGQQLTAAGANSQLHLISSPGIISGGGGSMQVVGAPPINTFMSGSVTFTTGTIATTQSVTFTMSGLATAGSLSIVTSGAEFSITRVA